MQKYQNTKFQKFMTVNSLTSNFKRFRISVYKVYIIVNKFNVEQLDFLIKKWHISIIIFNNETQNNMSMEHSHIREL